MSTPFPRWQEALTQANNDAARHTLTGEVSRWRAAHLVDVVGQRDAAYALAKLYRGLGDGASALREAQGLLSLCRTPPMSPDAELDVASQLVVDLGGKAPKRRAPRVDPRASGARPARGAAGNQSRGDGRAGGQSAGSSPVERAMELGRKGEFADAFRLLKGKSSPQVFAARVWLDLSRALAETDEQRDKRLRALMHRMEQILPRSARPTPVAASKPVPPPTGRLGDILGRGLPGRRPAMLRLLHRFIDDNPTRADEVAAAALLDHIDEHGIDFAAPWLAGLVARGMADEGPLTIAALASSREAGASAAAIYDEAPFWTLVAQWQEARSAGMRFVDLRRGTMRGEPDDRRLWTLRVATDAGEGLLVLGESQDAPYDGTLAVEIAKRLLGLSDKPVLVAPGAGNAELRAAAGALDVAVVEVGDALAAVQSRLVARRADARAARENAASPPTPSVPAAPRRPTLAEYVNQVRAVLTGEGTVTVDALEPLVAPIKRIRDVLELGDELVSADAGERIKALVLAIHRTAPSHVRLLQATTLLLRASARPGQESLADMLTAGEAAERLGGAGMPTVISASRALQQAGFTLDRVLRGATRRERREHPAVDVLAEHLEGLWRVVVVKGDVRGEVWIADSLPAEGQAGLPQLALRAGPRVALVGEALVEGWNSVGAPAIVSLEGLVGAAESWTAASE